MSKAVARSGSNKSLSAALLTTVVLTLGVSLAGCSSEHEEEILAVDRVDQAADIARQLAPKAEDMAFPEVVAAPMPDATATDMTVPADSAEAVATDAPATEDLAVNVGAELYNKQCMACIKPTLTLFGKAECASIALPSLATSASKISSTLITA